MPLKNKSIKNLTMNPLHNGRKYVDHRAKMNLCLFAAGMIFVVDYNVLVSVIDAYDLLIILTNKLATLQDFKFKKFLSKVYIKF